MGPHIVIAGGGFAGTTLVRTLQRTRERGAGKSAAGDNDVGAHGALRRVNPLPAYM